MFPTASRRIRKVAAPLVFAVVAALGVTAPMVWALDEFATPRPTPKSQAPIKTQAPLGNRVTEVSVLRTPDVVGQPVATAHVTLEKNRLRVGRETTQPTSGRAAGTVLGQDPKAGTPVQPGAAVNLVIAAPARVVAAPAPWKRLPIERVPSGNRVPSDDAGGSTPPPQRVVLVPNLIGRQATIASEILAKPGLRLGERRDQDSDAPAGTVIAQFPAPETPVRPGTSVNVTIAVDDRVTVPDLTRDTLPQAARVLREYHLGLGQHHERESSAPTGTVIGQAPAPGTRVAPGTPVNVQIAKAPAPVLPPAPTPPPGVVPPPVVIAPPAIPPIVIQPPAPPAPPVVAAPPTPPAPQLPPVPPAPPVTTAPPPPPPAPPVAAPSPTPAPASKPTPKPRQPTPAVRPAPRAPAASQSPTVAQSPAPKPAPPIVAQAPAPEPDQPKRGWPSPIALGLGSAALLAAAGAVYYRMRTVNGTTLPSITYAAHWDLGTQQIEAVAPLSLGVGLRLHSGVEVATTTLETNTLVATGHQMGGTG